ncbi:oxygen-dependent tRNA uridine(34) hydroxylase TrhO [Caldalkalibacillus mannanilyticus]|uniref:oxygen-dependent tRNA uridine(34) hydroxylase TrhO n=1 Tax=Caldalkalibacillus mannanilyticus TaxID=1418 RepID=UPI00046A2EAD|nr:rhodanese-related sulfurtransferase [Caldalkalibacillus mannanilyticus]
MSIKQEQYQVLLYYKYIPIENPEQFAKEHLKRCQELELKGRILVATEGINGTVSGTIDQTNEYMKIMHENPLFHDMVFKIDRTEGHAFKKMHVRPRKELVTFNLEDDVDPNQVTGAYLSPKEFYETLQNEDVIILDGRNHYEYEIGHFRGAIRPGVKSTREFPEWIRENLSQYKDKKILTYCTGGIRCEKLSGFLKKEGFSDVSQLHGGIVTYGQDPEVKGQLFDGKCYVFDDRIAVPINQVEDIIVSQCSHCGQPADRYLNCADVTCDQRHICCEQCEPKYQRFCSSKCLESNQHYHQA